MILRFLSISQVLQIVNVDSVMTVSCWYIALQLKTQQVSAIFEFPAKTSNKTYLNHHSCDKEQNIFQWIIQLKRLLACFETLFTVTLFGPNVAIS